MTAAPERIVAGPSVGWQLQATWKNGDWDLNGETISYAEFGVEYIRADLLDAADARVKELEAVVKSLSRLDTQADIDRAKREARVEGMRTALASLENVGFTAPAKRTIRALIAAEERGEWKP